MSETPAVTSLRTTISCASVIGQRREQHGLDDGEDGGVGADADRQRQNGGEA